MTNVSELLIHAVIKNKPKLLTGLDQKGAWSDVPRLIGDTLTH